MKILWFEILKIRNARLEAAKNDLPAFKKELRKAVNTAKRAADELDKLKKGKDGRRT